MTFAKKMMGFPSDVMAFSIKLPSKRHEKTRVTFSTGLTTKPLLIFRSDNLIKYGVTLNGLISPNSTLPKKFDVTELWLNLAPTRDFIATVIKH